MVLRYVHNTEPQRSHHEIFTSNVTKRHSITLYSTMCQAYSKYSAWVDSFSFHNNHEVGTLLSLLYR